MGRSQWHGDSLSHESALQCVPFIVVSEKQNDVKTRVGRSSPVPETYPNRTTTCSRPSLRSLVHYTYVGIVPRRDRNKGRRGDALD